MDNKQSIPKKDWLLRKSLVLKVGILVFSFILMGSLLLETKFATRASAAEAVKLNKTKVTIEVGKAYTLKISGTKVKAVWTTSNKKIAKVNQSGKVTGVKKGTATITATVGGKKYTCKVTVKAASKTGEATATPKPTPKPTKAPVEINVPEGYLTVKQLKDKISNLQKKYNKMEKDDIKVLVVGANLDYITDEVLMEVLGAETKADLTKWGQKLEDAIYNKSLITSRWHMVTIGTRNVKPNIKYNEIVKLNDLFFDKDVKKHCAFIEDLIETIATKTRDDYEYTRAAKVTLIGHFYDFKSLNFGRYIEGFKFKHNDPKLEDAANYVINMYYVDFTASSAVMNTTSYAPVKDSESDMLSYVDELLENSNPLELRAKNIKVK